MDKLNRQELFSVEDIAEILGVSKRTVYRLIEQKLIPPGKRIGVGKAVRWCRWDIQQYLHRVITQDIPPDE